MNVFIPDSVSHKLFTKSVEYCMFYHEKTILYTKVRYIEDHIFCLLSYICKIWYSILGNSTIMRKVYVIQKDNKNYVDNRYKELM